MKTHLVTYLVSELFWLEELCSEAGLVFFSMLIKSWALRRRSSCTCRRSEDVVDLASSSSLCTLSKTLVKSENRDTRCSVNGRQVVLIWYQLDAVLSCAIVFYNGKILRHILQSLQICQLITH